jgi:hypothetical protein
VNIRFASPSVVKVPTLVILASVLAAGCSPNADTTRNVAAVSEELPAAAPTPKDGGANPLPTKMANDPGIRQNIVQTKCEAIPGGWSAQGTAKNPGKKAVTYKVIVHFTTTKATTLDYAQTLVKVPPGKTVTWNAKKHFAAKPEMLCPMPGISIVS